MYLACRDNVDDHLMTGLLLSLETHESELDYYSLSMLPSLLSLEVVFISRRGD